MTPLGGGISPEILPKSVCPVPSARWLTLVWSKQVVSPRQDEGPQGAQSPG